MSTQYNIPALPLTLDIESKDVLRQLNRANRSLAELKGIAATIPNEQILISTLTLQEARESSAVENIVTTQDDLYQASISLNHDAIPAAAKEVLNYREAIQYGFDIVRRTRMLRNNDIIAIQERLVHNRAGFRTTMGTTLKRADGEVVYTPPQDGATIQALMANLERYINDGTLCDLDPLIKMAIIHHQFESIHPFYDGNGRTGRIVNVLFLVMNGLLDLPILYLSRYITRNKAEYYRLLQTVRNKNDNNADEWEAWILFMLKGVEQTAEETIEMVKGIARLMQEFKQVLRPQLGKRYKHEVLNNLFHHPYTKIEFFERDLQVGRQTAAKYLDQIVEVGLLRKEKKGRENYYINLQLMELLSSQGRDVSK